jgi:hypothetical protein
MSVIKSSLNADKDITSGYSDTVRHDASSDRLVAPARLSKRGSMYRACSRVANSHRSAPLALTSSSPASQRVWCGGPSPKGYSWHGEGAARSETTSASKASH